MAHNRIREFIRPSPPAPTTGFVLVAVDTLPASMAAATAARQDFYRLAYAQALEAADGARRVRRWIFWAAQTPTAN